MAMQEVTARLDRIDARLERWEAEFRDLNAEQRRERAEARGFMDASLVRYGQITDEMVGALQALGAEILAQRQVSEAAMADQHDEIRANTQAVLRLLDERFGPEPPQG
jgi:hypothetical protein